MSCWNPNYTLPPLKNRSDVALLQLFLSKEFAYGSFQAVEALSSLDNKRRQNGVFLFQFGFFLTHMCCPEMPATSSAVWA